MKSFFFACVLIFSSVCGMTGCAHRYVSGFSTNYLIDPQDLKGKIRLNNCKPRGLRHNCTLVYECKHPGCEVIEVHNGKSAGVAR